MTSFGKEMKKIEKHNKEQEYFLSNYGNKIIKQIAIHVNKKTVQFQIKINIFNDSKDIAIAYLDKILNKPKIDVKYLNKNQKTITVTVSNFQKSEIYHSIFKKVFELDEEHGEILRNEIKFIMTNNKDKILRMDKKYSKSTYKHWLYRHELKCKGFMKFFFRSFFWFDV